MKVKDLIAKLKLCNKNGVVITGGRLVLSVIEKKLVINNEVTKDTVVILK